MFKIDFISNSNKTNHGTYPQHHTDPIVYYHATDKMFHEMRAQREMAEVMAEEDGLFLSVMHRDQVKHREAQLKREKELKLELKLAEERIEELQNLLPEKADNVFKSMMIHHLMM